MKVLKFGGTSVGSADAFKKVKEIALKSSSEQKTIIVVSAVSQMTNLLQRAADKAACGDANYTQELELLEQKHIDIIRELIPLDKFSSVIAEFKSNLNKLEDILKGIFLIEELSEKSSALVLSHGEKFSSKILYHFFKIDEDKTFYLDSTKLVVANGSFLNATLDNEATKANLIEANKEDFKLAVMPGFVANNSKGQLTTLGRGGSDYSASIVAASLNANRLEIWTDVSGMLTADPRIVKQAHPIKSVSFDEAMELSHFGAKVIYPPSIQPAMSKGIPMAIKNTFAPNDAGTEIMQKADSDNDITGLSAIQGLSLIDIKGAGMVAIPGYASRVFGSLSLKDVNIILITQASSEHSITIAVKTEDANNAITALENEFERELESGKIHKLKREDELSIIALVGDNMKSRSGLSGRAFSALGHNGINIRAIAQGSTEKNISLVVKTNNTKKAMNVLHEEFFLGDYKKIHLFLAGMGNVGGALIEQIKEQNEFLKKNQHVELVVSGMINSRKFVVNENGIDLNNWKEEIEASENKADLNDFLSAAKELNKRNSVFVDNTANDKIADIYEPFLASQISVVCSNKVAASSSLANYKKLKETAKENGVKYLFEANVGAGLPIIDTINNLVNSGDKIIKIQGVLSGSLSFIFDSYNGTTPFSEIVTEAKNEGFTEPDPRVDLSGKDVGRKILILAREAGYDLEPEQVDSESFMPESCLKPMDVKDFIKSLDAEENAFKKMYNDAQQKNEKLKIVGTFENGKAKVKLESLDSSSPFAGLKGTDNMVLIYTQRYPKNPMIIQGAGAGASVTAAGVFGDILRTQN
ncbi:MAG: bifunctional aspartate kinase/homoserine dehydrogenase I [Ichthyobacteriaceae bacterium]|nr:bifunctional aspartate kinase/homoserine dehydrogenase I [Ichthyobacteriaceae bacterium]